ncbi:MAG: cytochrome c, partial [Thermoanaerobaculia bacterium]
LGAAQTAAPAPPISPPPAGDRGATLYRVLCSQCHGVQGNGKGINAPSLFVSPRDHSSFDEMSALTDERIFAAIKRGGASVGKSTLMPSWGGVLGDDDIHLLVDYLRRLSKTEAH